jgi:hypothetical protein
MRWPCSFFICRTLVSASELKRDAPTVTTITKTESNSQPRRLRALDAPSNPDQVLTFPEWCALNTLSERTGRRILKSGNGSPVTELSSYRIGITVGDNHRWQMSRKRK